jgi:hypothetical protein
MSFTNVIALLQEIDNMGVFINHMNCKRDDSSNLPIRAAFNNPEPLTDSNFTYVRTYI